MIIASNRSLAEFNLSKEPELEDLKSQVQQKSEHGEQLCNRIKELLEEYSKTFVHILNWLRPAGSTAEVLTWQYRYKK